jgi:hypothetical protein
MKYGKRNLEKLNNKIKDNEYLLSKCRKKDTDFIRNRKLTPKDLILYNLNNRGKTIKMELNEFIEKCNLTEVSDVALLKQREKLNEEIFRILNKESLFDFYHDFKKEVKTFKNHLLLVTDGSDCEVPNTKATREKYKAKHSKKDERIARITLSNCYDVLNGFILDTLIRNYRYSERELAKEHLQNINDIIANHKFINIKDRGYFSLSSVYHAINNTDKFVMRIPINRMQIEQKKMQSDDESVEIEYQYDRIRAYKDIDSEFYNYYESGKTMKIRMVKILLSTGETEVLLTNLDKKTFTKEDINYIYARRWGIETNYGILKNSMMITNISSSKDGIIKQEIYSSMLVHNILQGLILDAETEIDQEKYKHKMKINFNMAIGFTKRYLILILIEENPIKQKLLSDTLFKKILTNIIPIRSNRKYKRNRENNAVYNRFPINKRKSY